MSTVLEKDVQTDKSREHEDIPATAAQLTSPRGLHGIPWVLVVIATLSSLLLYSLDNTIVANIVPAILNDLGSDQELPWLSVGFLMGGLCVALPFGRLYGMFDVKVLYCASIILFMAGSALCGGAPNMSAIIVGRVIAGVGGNGMYVGVVTLLSVNTTPMERPVYLAFVGLIYGLGTVIGPIIGGAFADSSATWRWGFYLNLVVGGVFAPIYVFLLPSHKPNDNSGLSSWLRRFDYAGFALQTGMLASGIMAINFGGTLYAWDSGQIIALFIVAGVLLVLFALQQTFCFLTDSQSRMFPVHFMKLKEPVLLAMLMGVNNGGTFVLMYYIPLFFQFARGTSSLSSGVELLPFIVFVTATIMANGAVLGKTGFYQPWYVVGNILIVIGGVLFSRISLGTSNAVVYGFEVLLGVGFGSYLQSGYAIIQAVLEPSDMSYAVTFMLLAQLLGVALSLSISGAVFVNVTLVGLQNILPNIPRQQLQAAISGTSGDFFTTLSPAREQACLNVIMASLQKVYIQLYVVGALGLILSAFLSRRKLNLAPPEGR